MLVTLEGIDTTIYSDVVGIPTIGVGHVLTQYERASGKIELSSGEVLDIRNGLTQAQVMNLMLDDVAQREGYVNDLVKVDLEQYQFDALVSWVFNVGLGAMRNSTLLRRLNSGEYDAVPEELRRWTKGTINGKKQTIRGLVNRRNTEIAMWLGQNPQANTAGQDARPDYYVDDHDYGALPTYDDGKLVNQTPARRATVVTCIADNRASKVQGEVEKSAIYKLIARFVPPGYGANTTALVGFVVGLLDIAHDELMMSALPFIDYNIDGMTWVIGSVGLYFLRRAKG